VHQILEAGSYIVVVQAQRAGLEGTFDLSIITDRVVVSASPLQ
jgi:hypothetical protein